MKTQRRRDVGEDLYGRVIRALRGHGERELATELAHIKTAARRVRVVEGYDLRATQTNKYADCVQNTADWTCFVNRRGTLCHAMLCDRSDLLVRLPELKLAGCGRSYVTKTLEDKLTW
jgi:hypothetical protein